MKKIISSLLTLSLLAAPCSAFAKDYSDYPQKFWDLSKDHWAYKYVSELVDKNIISGYDDDSFKPSQTVTRAEWAKILMTASRLTNTNSSALTAEDVHTQDWFYTYVRESENYMNFYDIDGKKYFRPNQAASREDVTVSLVKIKGYDVSRVDYSTLSKFKDTDSISNNAKKYIAAAIEKKLIDGFDDGTFRGQDTLTRAEAATLLCRAFQSGDSNKTAGEENTGGGNGAQATSAPLPTQTPQNNSSDSVKIFIDGKETDINLDIEPIFLDGNVFLPLRFCSEITKTGVTWDAVAQTAVLQSANNIITIQVNNTTAYTSYGSVTFDNNCMKIVNSYAMVNINQVLSLMGYSVTVYQDSIYINSTGGTDSIGSKTDNTLAPKQDVPANTYDEQDIAYELTSLLIDDMDYCPATYKVKKAGYYTSYTDQELIRLICIESESNIETELFLRPDFDKFGIEYSNPDDLINIDIIPILDQSGYIKRIFNADEYAFNGEYTIFDVDKQQTDYGEYYYITTDYGKGCYWLSNKLTLEGLSCNKPEELIGKKFTKASKNQRVITKLSR